MIRVTDADKTKVQLSNGAQIIMPCKGKLWAYLEFIDRVVLVVNIYDTKHCNQFRNLFCYSKDDGHLIWQVEQAYHPDTKEPLDEVFKYIALHIRGEDGQWLSIEENGSLEVDHKCADDSEVGGQIYLKPFRYGVDRLSSMTWSQFPQEYWIDYETGKLEWFAYHQKI